MQDYIDQVLENGTVHLCGQQDSAEKYDEFLSSLEESALDGINGISIIIVVVSVVIYYNYTVSQKNM